MPIQPYRKHSKLLFPQIVKEAEKEAKLRGLKLKVMFEDEGRFGRISSPRRCWSPKGTRAVVGKQIVREYTYTYAAIDPKEGGLDSLILPDMYASTMSVFLKELSQRYPKYYILLVMDGAPCHRAGDLEVPDNIQIQEQPSYSPELNPVEHLWDEMREKWFHNETFDSMDSVEERIIQSLNVLENDQKLIQSISGFPWIMQCLVPS